MEPLCWPIQPPTPLTHTNQWNGCIGFPAWDKLKGSFPASHGWKDQCPPPPSFCVCIFFPQVSIWGWVPVATTGRKPLLRSAEKEAVGCSCLSLGRKRFKTPDRTGVIRPSRVAETDLRKTSYRFISWTFPANGLALQRVPPRPATFNYILSIISFFEAVYSFWGFVHTITSNVCTPSFNRLCTAAFVHTIINTLNLKVDSNDDIGESLGATNQT